MTANAATWFARRLLRWQPRHGRNDLPWQKSRDAYPVWLAEIMLQQTRVAAVVPYYERFVRRFPDVQTLAAARRDEVMHHWAGLGYYARARNLHRAAQVVAARGGFPGSLAEMQKLPGIGRSTAAAVLALTLNRPHAILDGNARRVLCRFYKVRGPRAGPGAAQTERLLWRIAGRNTPRRRAARYTQAIMDLGATVCVRGAPFCERCPVAPRCRARRHGVAAQLPAAAKRKPLPVKAVRMIFVRDERGRILLERRPAPGIWGGLWTPPQCAMEEDCPAALEKRFGIKIKTEPAGEVLRHGFTHYILEITPVPARVAGFTGKVMERPPVAWYEPAGPQRLGLAAPVKKLLGVYDGNR
ncbi:MAG: A/G-specific adenine glycosylase [Gammaproteobacteria bacterium]|nr:A/G-specific adenine glycosylase [Gammaproteobacteria bacterium]MDD9814727.1 A/G-specific adenine glycosylase [Gammaproteobacteria bacterium]MDD9851182.1 A/G-specific adenine glycosylase [Gammaproteobacteria bacterium]MDD9870608.1 A/G-specific adenine glycosylase [Gammaproteobacteria bacterium]